MHRRQFLLSSCGYCAALASFSVLGALLEGCKPSDLIYKADNIKGVLHIPLEKISDKKQLIIRTSQLDYDLLLVKESETTFHTLLMQCTHRQTALVATSTGLICNQHGSRFDLEGNVTRDPATQPLTHFPTEVEGQNILIALF